MIKAEVLAHSKTGFGAEAITMRITLPRILLSELNTHRKLAKNTSSSRAIPISKMIKHVFKNMFFPVYWGKNQSGMQAQDHLGIIRSNIAKFVWRSAGITACGFALMMNLAGVHKQITNRLIENFSYITVIFTTTDLNNLIHLRAHKDAQPEFRVLAEAIRDEYNKSTPVLLKGGDWHLPLITEEERSTYDIKDLQLISAARCASTSYQTVNGKQITIVNARKIAGKLLNGDTIHASPFEHQLTPDKLVKIDWRISRSKKKYQTSAVWESPHLHGNTIGFIQYRKLLEGESMTTDMPYFLQISS